METTLKEQIQKLPKSPGVYFFFDARGRLIYIGKAANIRNRVRSHFADSRNPYAGARERMIQEVHTIQYEEAASEIDALIREAEFIKRRRPRYNVWMRDDKNYSFVGFTIEPFPRIQIIHQPALKIRGKRMRYIGPFTSGGALKHTLYLLRSIFPYCTCRTPHKGYCLRFHIGRCYGFCCNKEAIPSRGEKEMYARNIRSIHELLSGKKKHLVSRLEKAMEDASAREEFEAAARYRDQLAAIRELLEHSHVLRDWQDLYSTAQGPDKALAELAPVLDLPAPPRRIECYDISNIQGKFAVGSMAVFTNGKKDASQYRRFKIKTVPGANDTAMLREVLWRRFSRPAHAGRKKENWPLPDLILIDGGKGQLHAGLQAVRETGYGIPVATLAKREEELYREGHERPIRLDTLPAPVKHLLQSLRDEAHRFAISYYRLLHRRAIRK